MTEARRRLRRVLGRVPGLLALARLVVSTIRICMRYRVTGLASEAGFFALLSLPPLVLGLFGGLGYVAQRHRPGRRRGRGQGGDQRRTPLSSSPPDVIDGHPACRRSSDVLDGPRFDLLSLGFLLSLWSGSRALNVFVDTISIMYGQSDVRGIVRTRALSFSLYLLALAGRHRHDPAGAARAEPARRHPAPAAGTALIVLYWPLVTLLTVGGLTSLYHISSTPRRSPWLRDAPGAVADHGDLWILASFVVRGTIAASLERGTSIYGPLSAPIVLLIWLYALAIAVLIGAALNAVDPRAVAGTRSTAACTSGSARGSAGCGARRTERRERPAGWDDPFDGYGSGRRRRRPRPVRPARGRAGPADPDVRRRPVDAAGRRQGAVRSRRPADAARPRRRRPLRHRRRPAASPVWRSSRRSDNVCEHAKGVRREPRRARM